MWGWGGVALPHAKAPLPRQRKLSSSCAWGTSMRGTIEFYLHDKGYGFLTDESGVRRFFHKTEIMTGTSTVTNGVAVDFTPAEVSGKAQAKRVSVLANVTPTGPRSRMKRGKGGVYAGHYTHLSSEALYAALFEISRWKLEAKLDNVTRYFFHVPALVTIISGDASYVIGRKGTGKTALAQYISETPISSQFVTTLSFKNFPFNDLYKLENNSFTRPNQYITAWKLIIYSFICRMMSDNAAIDPLIRQKILKVFPTTDNDNLSAMIGRWVSGDLGFSIAGTGVTLGNLFQKKNEATIQQKVENLEAFILKHIDQSQYFVLFDELDEDYKDIFETYKKSEYIDLLTSLFKAVQDVRSSLTKRGPSVYPVVFLRDDIYDLIQDSDKNKWRDLTVQLEWTPAGIKDLLAFRIAKAIKIDQEEFNHTWYSLFETDAVPYSDGKKQISSFDFITRSTQGRPRDYIRYLQACASLQLERSSARISVPTIREADKSYSNYLRNELIDEMHGLVPEISGVFRVISQIRKWNFSVEEFREAYLQQYAIGAVKSKDVDFILQTLFYFSVVGNSVRPGVEIFRYQNPEAMLNFTERLVVHRGLMKSLQII